MDEELVEPMRMINARTWRLKNVKMPCPKCSATMRLIGITFFPKFVCDNCFAVRRYEPLKLIKEEVK